MTVADKYREMEDEDDEETQEWEMAQARRAGGWQDEEPEKPVKQGYRPTPSESPQSEPHVKDQRLMIVS